MVTEVPLRARGNGAVEVSVVAVARLVPKIEISPPGAARLLGDGARLAALMIPPVKITGCVPPPVPPVPPPGWVNGVPTGMKTGAWVARSPIRTTRGNSPGETLGTAARIKYWPTPPAARVDTTPAAVRPMVTLGTNRAGWPRPAAPEDRKS